jgi:hypothetical protein
MPWPSREQVGWGILGAIAAGAFSIWMFFIPDSIPRYFAWDVQPRYAQAFIGAGYLFRTAFFLYAARQPNWFRLRWIVPGNLAFTGTLLLATYWHVDEFNWNPLQTPLAHIWIILYIFEPIVMLYLVPRGILRAEAPPTGGPVLRSLRRFLILVTGLLLMNGLLLVINPEFAATRWAWELNPLDARIVAAWFLGWSIWCGTMAFARDWDEIRAAAALFILNGLALAATVVIFRDSFLPGRGTPVGYGITIGVMTALMIVFFLVQDRRRPRVLPPPTT